MFADFVTLSTEVVARIRIEDETKVVKKDGGLWYEENIPAETMFYSLVMATDVLRKEEEIPIKGLKTADDVMDFFQLGLKDRFQLGGNQTIGRGIIRTRLLKGGSQ